MPDDAHPPPDPAADSLSKRRHILAEAIAHAAHYLPAQGPLEVFVHHNTLHAFQHLPFHQAMAEASRRLGARCYLKEEEYRAALRSGRILEADVRSCLRDALPPRSPQAASPPWPSDWLGLDELRLRLQLYGLREASPAALQWLLDETDATRQLRDDLPPDLQRALLAAQLAESTAGHATTSEAAAVSDLYLACQERAADTVLPAPTPPPSRPAFPRDLLIAAYDEDPDDLVHPTLIPLCAAFLDRGQAQLNMPLRAQGFYSAWSHIETTGYVLRSAWERQLGKRIRRTGGLDPESVVLALLAELGIADAEIAPFIEHLLLQLPGWAGMFHRLEGSTQVIGLIAEAPQVRLIDFLAVRLSLDVLAYLDIAAHHGFVGELPELMPFLRRQPQLSLQASGGTQTTAWALFNVAQLAGISAARLRRATREQVAALLHVTRELDPSTRLRVFHEAYERNYRDGVLAALSARRQQLWPERAARLQVVCCIDDRMESFRRHLEENYPDVETYGAAGFFNLAIAFQGLDDPATFPLCPVVVQPQHRIVEQPDAADAERFAQRQRRRQRWQRANSQFARASRSLLLGSIVTAFAGWLATLPLLLNVFLPKSAARLRKLVTRNLLPEVRTQLSHMRTADARAAATADLYEGFSLEEKAARVAGLLENIGLTRNFGSLVVVIGHDSSSVNNPHFAAYSCGACGGRSGGPNARLFARMANRAEVRTLLRGRGIDIPDSTVFVGGVHDTCTDSIRLFDESVPEDRLPELADLDRLFSDVLSRNAHERCRRFASASPRADYDDSLAHVEERAADLSQARPELGHATNAACIVGRRRISQGVFLDRRAFLVSYDPTIDGSGAILERILMAVGPVCAGINLEYYFSTVDNERLGAGTKLPHNVTGLIAVMNGAGSDLRTGLPKQMIEIHEPVRLQLIVDAAPQTLTAIISRQPPLAELFNNAWVQLIAVDPDSGQASVYRDGRHFAPWQPHEPQPPTGAEASDTARSLESVPQTATSRDWFLGKRHHIPPALIAAPSQGTARAEGKKSS
jgi:uncharacterized protein YbcC (UPF0753/DUF2309 family)